MAIVLNQTAYLGATPDPAAATRQAMDISRQGLMPIAEVFYSLQGEGLRAGEATVFVRFAGCNCDCWFCDTDFRVRRTYALDSLLDEIDALAGACRWVCLTGGEPAIHDLQSLCDCLHARGYKLQMETNGSRARADWRVDHITVSPKVAQGARLDQWFLENATEFKHVVTDENDLALALSLSSGHGKPVSLQPNALTSAAAHLCIEAVKTHPLRLRLSLQTHKVLEIR